MHAGDAPALVKLPGIGKKTAERLIIEMRDRLGDMSSSTVTTTDGSLSPSLPLNPVEEAVSALIALGYKAPDASRRIRAVDCEGLTTQDIIRAALTLS